MSVRYKFDYSREKDLILRESRDIGFRDIIESISKKQNILSDIEHFNKKKYPNQRIYIVKFEDNVYAVPYVVDKLRKVKFLKTIYQSRTLKRKYLK